MASEIPLGSSWACSSRTSEKSLAMSSSVMSRMRPGQLSDRGRFSRTIAGSASLVSASIGALMASLKLMPTSENFRHVFSASRMDFSVKATRLSASAVSMKALGGMMPHAGKQLDARQVLALEIDLGLVPEFDPAFAQRHVELDLLGQADGEIEPLLLHHPLDDRAVERLAHGRQESQAVALAQLPHRVESARVAAAHELDRAAVGAFRQYAERLHGVAAQRRNVDEHQVGPAPHQGTAQRRRVGKQAGLDAVSLQHERHEMAVRRVLVDDEAHRRLADFIVLVRHFWRGRFFRQFQPAELVDHAGTGKAPIIEPKQLLPKALRIGSSPDAGR